MRTQHYLLHTVFVNTKKSFYICSVHFADINLNWLTGSPGSKVPGFFVYCSMEIILNIGEESYSISKNIDNPHTENVMYAIECLIKKAPLDKEVVEEYIRAWAEEIDKKV